MLTLNFWESFAFNTAIGALQSLAGLSTKLSPEQKADISGALTAIQKVESDFSAA